MPKNLPVNIKGLVYESIEELAARTDMKRSWWYARTRETGPGSVPRVKFGKYLRFVPHEVDAWLRDRGAAS
jgi:predicted DNA-binding transcriptional regulator AlpA